MESIEIVCWKVKKPDDQISSRSFGGIETSHTERDSWREKGKRRVVWELV